jgi:hypothetical protein
VRTPSKIANTLLKPVGRLAQWGRTTRLVRAVIRLLRLMVLVIVRAVIAVVVVIRRIIVGIYMVLAFVLRLLKKGISRMVHSRAARGVYMVANAIAASRPVLAVISVFMLVGRALVMGLGVFWGLQSPESQKGHFSEIVALVFADVIAVAAAFLTRNEVCDRPDSPGDGTKRADQHGRVGHHAGEGIARRARPDVVCDVRPRFHFMRCNLV